MFVVDTAWRLLVFLVVAAAILVPIERLAAGRARWPPRVPLIVGLLFVSALLTSLLSTTIAAWSPAMFDPRARPDWARFAALVLATELASYGLHRWMHASPRLWRFHRLHHQPGRLFWMDAWYQHPVDAALHIAAATALAVLLQVPLAAHAPVLLGRKLYTAFLHADGRWSPSRLDRLVATPAFHHSHHDGAGGNYAGLLPILDVLFGTWRRPHRGGTIASSLPLSSSVTR